MNDEERAPKGLEGFILHPSTFIISVLGVLGDGREDGEELLGFIMEGFEFGGGNDAAAGEEFEPVGSLVEFFEAVADFGDELGFGACAVGFTEVGADGGSRPQDLLAHDQSFF